MPNTKYEWTPKMEEISGFGGSYEDACRAMVKAGMLWLDEHPDAEPLFYGLEGVMGVVVHENADGEAMSRAMVAAAGGDCTGAMHQKAIEVSLWAHKHGWDAYVALMEGTD